MKTWIEILMAGGALTGCVAVPVEPAPAVYAAPPPAVIVAPRPHYYYPGGAYWRRGGRYWR